MTGNRNLNRIEFVKYISLYGWVVEFRLPFRLLAKITIPEIDSGHCSELLHSEERGHPRKFKVLWDAPIKSI
jgi:hypothetical protein